MSVTHLGRLRLRLANEIRSTCLCTPPVNCHYVANR